MSGSIAINKNNDRYVGCNCYSGRDDNNALWNINLSFGVNTTAILLCMEQAISDEFAIGVGASDD